SVPIAAALIAKGISPGAALVFLIVGPATNGATVATVWKVLGWKPAVGYLISIAGCALASGLLLDTLFPDLAYTAAAHIHHTCHTLLGHLLAAALLVILIVGIITRKPVKNASVSDEPH
ncbi:MAG TPA: permease, partial [Sedimentisphaerales bacterium]|nr:permease [Sedimentisphaerales bacterium]